MITVNIHDKSCHSSQNDKKIQKEIGARRVLMWKAGLAYTSSKLLSMRSFFNSKEILTATWFGICQERMLPIKSGSLCKCPRKFCQKIENCVYASSPLHLSPNVAEHRKRQTNFQDLQEAIVIGQDRAGFNLTKCVLNCRNKLHST